MDCYSAESEFIESLDFLSPPVKRIASSRQTFGSDYNSEDNDVHLLRGFRNKYFAPPPPCFQKHTNTVNNSESTTSLILKKTSERQILGQQYSFVSFPSLEKPQDKISNLLKPTKLEKKPNTSGKPLIKVTVIPKKDQVQAAKLLRRRRYIPKRVQSTTSNHENSIQTKNVYLIVAGRRREKVYEIKTTGSAKFSTDHDSYSKNEDTPVSELTNFQQLIQSLSMDKKKKKEKLSAAAETSEAPHAVDWNNFQNCINCMNKEPRDRQAPKKSRVRIFGQLGISDEDKYVLRYGATVDEKTVMSDVAQLTRDVISNASYDTTGEQSPCFCRQQQQSSSLQADHNYDLDIEKLPASDVLSKESQGTQVNFEIEVPAVKEKCGQLADKKVQCSCCGNRSDPNPNTLKDCQSPMVIISVYPKANPEDATKSVPAVITSTSPTAVNTYSSNHALKTEKALPKLDTKRNSKSPRIQSRSPSPVRKASKPKLPDNSIKVPVSEKKSPDRQKALRAIKEKIREKDKLKQDASFRKPPLKLNTNHSTQVSKIIQNQSVSNATQVSKKNHTTASHGTQIPKEYYPKYISNGTQVSANRIQNYTASSATQYSNDAQSFTASTQCEDTIDSLQDISPVKHSINDTMNSASQRYQHPQFSAITHFKTQVSNATQVPAQQLYSGQSTQVSKNGEPIRIAMETQVSKGNPKVFAPRMAKNQETFISKPAQSFKSEQTSRYTPKLKVEMGTNTDHAQTKKALVETYTKRLTEQMIQKQYDSGRFDNSKVRVNIEGDRDYYDVLFNRDTLTTDLRIRKTLKDMDTQKCKNERTMGDRPPRLPNNAVQREGLRSRNKSPTRSPPVAVYNNPSDDALEKNVSRLTIRDSLEICHRREDKNSNNKKETHTCFTAQFSDGVEEETEFSAPMKHFIGDDCSISDPVERDRQIRDLLGVKPNYSKTSQGRFCENDVGIPYQCIYRQKCKESQVTEINFEFTKLCPCFKPHQKKQPNVSVSVQCRQKHCKARLHRENAGDGPNLGNTNYPAEGKIEQIDDKQSALYQQLILNRNIQVFLQVEQFSKQKPIILSRQQYDKVKKTIQKTISTKRSSQYGKLKKLMGMPDENREASEISIGEVRTKKIKETEQLKKNAMVQGQSECECKSSSEEEESSGCCEIAAQTDPIRCNKKNCRSSKLARKSKNRKSNIDTRKPNIDNRIPSTDTRKPNIDTRIPSNNTRKQNFDNRKSNFDNRKSCFDNRKSNFDNRKSNFDNRKSNYDNRNENVDMTGDSSDRSLVRSETRSRKSKKREEIKTIFKPRPGIVIEQDVGVGDTPKQRNPVLKKDCSVCCVCDKDSDKGNELQTYVLFNAQKGIPKDAKETEYAHTRRTLSSVEIHYASVAFMKQVAHSSTDVGALSESSLDHLNSFQTLFRGHRKCATPNLGTSAYSLYSEEGYNSENKCAKLEPQDSKPRKPFLRRLMSCLVMRSTRDSQLKLPIGPPPDLPSVNSSIDSYHISTSLGAMEVSSSIYDTSASFYSNHTILPVNSKIKRGFFSSVRGFLTNRKS